MSAEPDRELQQWAADWQHAAAETTTEAEIRDYVRRRGGLLRIWAAADLVIAAIALPLLAYLAWTARSGVERYSMLSLAAITIATVGFGWWNWRGVLALSATSTAEYVAMSAERLRRMRTAWRIGWLVLAGQAAIFTVWISDHLYSVMPARDTTNEVFAWGWLATFSFAAAIGLLWFGRWIARDAARFERLRRELE